MSLFKEDWLKKHGGDNHVSRLLAEMEQEQHDPPPTSESEFKSSPPPSEPMTDIAPTASPPRESPGESELPAEVVISEQNATGDGGDGADNLSLEQDKDTGINEQSQAQTEENYSEVAGSLVMSEITAAIPKSVRFGQFPMWLYQDPWCGLLSLCAKSVYQLIYNRLIWSIQNLQPEKENASSKGKQRDYRDERGVIYCCYAQKELAHQLHVCPRTISTAIAELRNLGLTYILTHGKDTYVYLRIPTATLNHNQGLGEDKLSTYPQGTQILRTQDQSRRYAKFAYPLRKFCVPPTQNLRTSNTSSKTERETTEERETRACATLGVVQGQKVKASTPTNTAKLAAAPNTGILNTEEWHNFIALRTSKHATTPPVVQLKFLCELEHLAPGDLNKQRQLIVDALTAVHYKSFAPNLVPTSSPQPHGKPRKPSIASKPPANEEEALINHIYNAQFQSKKGKYTGQMESREQIAERIRECQQYD